MLIRCPQCQFERDIDTGAIPATATMATCPRCGQRFRFRDAAGAPSHLPAPPETPREDSPAREERVAPVPAPVAVPVPPSGRRLPTEQEGDDPLPPGAVIPDLPYLEDAAPSAQTPLEADPSAPSSSGRDRDEARTIPPVLAPKATERASSGKSWFSFGKKRKEAGDDENAPPEPVPSRPHMPEDRVVDAPPGAAGGAAGGAADKPSSPARAEARPELRMNNGRAWEAGDASPLDWRGEELFMVPWEHPEVFGLVGSFVQTVLRAMFRPQDLFRAVGRDFPVFRAILFFILLRCFGTLVTMFWIRVNLQRLLASGVSAETEASVQILLGSMSAPLLVLFIPFMMLIALFLHSFFFFIMLRLANPDKADFNTVLRVVAYSAAPYVLCVVPVLGAHAASMLSAALCFIGCRFAFRLTWGRTMLALAPFYLLWVALRVFTFNAATMMTSI